MNDMATETMAALNEQCYAAFVESWRMLARATPQGVVEEHDGVTLIATGLVIPPFNPMFVTGIPAEPQAIIDQARAFYARNQVAWMARAIAPVAETFAPFASAAQLVATPATPGMILAPMADQPPPLPALTIRRVDDRQALHIHNDIVATVFEMPRELLAPLDSPGMLDSAAMTLYVGYMDDQPVATGLRCSAQNVAVIYNICTLPAYQRQGIGTAMTWHAVAEGANEGCTASFLEATPLGYPVYQGMGYQQRLDIVSWHEAAG